MSNKPIETEKGRSKKWIAATAVLLLAACVGVSVTAKTVNQGAGEDTQTSEATLTKEQEKKQAAIKATYNIENQVQIAETLEQKKEENEYTEDHILIEYNPFGTNTQSAYVYFETEENTKVSYTIQVSDRSIEDFSQDTYQEHEYQKEHEFQIIGLIPDMENQVEFTILSESGEKTTRSYSYNMGSLQGEEEVILETDVDSESAQELSDGLYVVLGNDDSQLDFMYYYDNMGILRGEVPLIGYRSHRLLFSDHTMYYSISENQMAAVNYLGQVVGIYDLGQYNLHHDYVFDDENNILILATDTAQDSVEDVVVKLDTDTGEVTGVLELGDLLGDYKASCVVNGEDELDWIHINTIQWLGEGDILLSSRETSTILKVSGIDETPQIEYMLGADEFWEDTGYENLLLTKDGEFTIQGGQHSITYVEDASLEDGQYYLYMFNNNVGYSETRPDFDWSSVGLTESTAKEGEASYYYKYLVDETNQTYQLIDSFEVPYSGYVSSAQEVDGNVVIDSGMAGTFGEYDKEHNLIASYKMEVEKFMYRVYKYDFQTLWN